MATVLPARQHNSASTTDSTTSRRIPSTPSFSSFPSNNKRATALYASPTESQYVCTILHPIPID